MTALASCVLQRESSGDWHNDGEFDGGYQFTEETWQSVEHMMGVWWSATADQATPSQQTAAFLYYEPKDPGAWPNTVPMCGG